MSNRKVIVYIAMSLDGCIATHEGSLDFLSLVTKEGEDYGYESFTKTVDTILLGRKTFEKVVSIVGEYPIKDKEVFVITRSENRSEGNVHFYNGDLASLIDEIRIKDGQNIYCDGGAEVVHMLLNEKLIDECIISIIPTILGGGIRLFKEGVNPSDLNLISATTFDTGLVQLHYSIIK